MKGKTGKEPASSPGLMQRMLSSSLARTLAVVFALLIVFFIYILAQPPPAPPVNSFYQEPLSPVAGLKLASGEKYTYRIGDSSTGMEVEHDVLGLSNGCLLVDTKFQNMSIPTCLDEKTGESVLPSTAEGAQDLSGAGKPSPEFSQPWMLALKENWTWRNELNTTSEMLGQTEEIVSAAQYSVISREETKGRDSFKVKIFSTFERVSNGAPYNIQNSTEFVWVDADKRILLYAFSEDDGISTELISGPFQVKPFNSSS